MNERTNTNPDSSAGADEFTVMAGEHEDNPGFAPEALVVIIEGSDDNDGTTYCMCGCGEATNKGSKYRQGHDARMKGKLIRAGRAGVEVVLASAGGLVSGDANTMASHFASSDSFVDKVTAGIERPAKQPKREAGVKNSTKAAVAEATGEPTNVKAKVGRWVYEGQIRNGSFVYNSRKGAPVHVETGKYTVID